MRHWSPLIADTLLQMTRDRRRRAAAIVLATHRSPPSWDAYVDAVRLGRSPLGETAPGVDFAPSWFEHPLFIEALAERTGDALEALPAGRRAGAALVFTAHSIPERMARESGYAEGLRRTALLVAGRLGSRGWSVAYTSRSGAPRDPWLEPDIVDALRSLAGDGVRDVVVSPIGFVSDHVEVLYDLDIVARRTAGELGIHLVRAGTAGTHPAFTRLLATLVRDVVSRA